MARPRKPTTAKKDGHPSKRPRIQPLHTCSSSGVPAPLPASQEQQTENADQMQPSSVRANPASILPERSMALQLRYRAWREAGSPHDPNCFECFQVGNLAHCDTCKRSYCQSCLQPGGCLGLGEGSQSWYCPVCVARGWHENPPPLTPPASPVQRLYAVGISTAQPVERAAPARSVPTCETSAETGQENAQSSRPQPTVATIASGSSQPRLYPATTQISQPTYTVDDGASRRNRKTTPEEAAAPSASRKSRFNTLSEDVDSALWVVYRELEGVPLLQRNVTDLESKVASLRQELNIQRNELALSRRASERHNVSEAELQRLRSEAASKQAAENEAEQLRTRNRELESEISEVRGELEMSTSTLHEWRQRLSTMLGGQAGLHL